MFYEINNHIQKLKKVIKMLTYFAIANIITKTSEDPLKHHNVQSQPKFIEFQIQSWHVFFNQIPRSINHLIGFLKIVVVEINYVNVVE